MSATEEQACTNHSEAAVAGQCGYCGKPICRDCIKQLGYYCSPDCLKSSRQAVTNQEKAESHENKQMMDTAAKLFKYASMVVGVLAVVIVAWLIWTWFLTPIGKVSWEVPLEGNLNNLHIINQQDGRVYIQTDAGIKIVDAESGEQTGMLNNPDVAGVQRLVATGSGFIGINARHILRLDADGKTVQRMELGGWQNSVTLSDDYTRAVYTSTVRLREPENEEEADGWRPVPTQTHLVALDLTTGDELWRKTLDRQANIGGLTLGDTRVYTIYSQHNGGARGPKHLLVAYDLKEGTRAWTYPMQEVGYAAPSYSDGVLLIESANRLLAFSTAGEILYTLTFDGEAGIDWFMREGLLFVGEPGGTYCYHFKSGMPLWRTKLEFSSEDIYIVKDRIFVHGTVTESTEINVGDMPGFNQHQDIAADFGLTNQTIDRSVQFLVAIDRRTGELEWQQDNVTGQFFCDGERLVLFIDTSQVGQLSMLKSDGDTVVRQYNPKNGDTFFERKLKGIGMGSPIMAGNRLVGIKYDQEEAIAKARPSMAEAAAGQAPKPTDSQGLLAIRLK